MLEALLKRGYFPRELPPAFSTDSYEAAFQGHVGPFPGALSLKRNHHPKKTAELLEHNLARPGRMRRKLGVPNPVLHYHLAKEICDSWTEIQTFVNEFGFSSTRPRLGTIHSRAIVGEYGFAHRPNLRAQSRAGGRYLLKADISSFYHSIYTHSVPWAVHTRAAAKRQRTDMNLLGNRLDTYICRGQDDQTKGIPIGPDTSLVIAEILLRKIDEELFGRLGHLRGFRAVDDYEICFQTLSEAEKGLAALQTSLLQFELDVNALKTEIIQLPHWLEEPWTVPLSSQRLSVNNPISQKYDLINLFTLAFSLSKQYPTASIIKYVLGRAVKTRIHTDNWELYQQLLLQCAVSEPGTLSYVVTQLVFYAARGRQIDVDLVRFALNGIVETESVVGQGNEVAWALWALLVFGLQLTESAAAELSTMEDSIVALLALDLRARNLAPTALNVSRWQALVSSAELYGKHWLLAYEAPYHGWLTLRGGGDPVTTSDDAFRFLRAQGVTFYEPPAGIDTIAMEIGLNPDATPDEHPLAAVHY